MPPNHFWTSSIPCPHRCPILKMLSLLRSKHFVCFSPKVFFPLLSYAQVARSPWSVPGVAEGTTQKEACLRLCVHHPALASCFSFSPVVSSPFIGFFSVKFLFLFCISLVHAPRIPSAHHLSLLPSHQWPMWILDHQSPLSLFRSD